MTAAFVLTGTSAAAAYERPAPRDRAAVSVPVTVVGQPRQMGVGEVQTAWADCPAGYYATGGGAHTSGGAPYLSISIGHPRSDAANRWFVDVRNYGTGPATVAAYVICDQATHYVREVITEHVPHGQTASATAHCPAGTTASGGGYSVVGDRSQFLVTDSGTSSGTDWRAEGVNYSAEPGLIVSQVICSTQTHHPRLGNPDNPLPRSNGSSVSECQPNELPTGGGQFVGAFVHPYNSYFEGRRWTVAAANYSDSRQHVIAQVICRPTG
ncbi:hypothetical protein [Streptomyces sp. NPDC059957]